MTARVDTPAGPVVRDDVFMDDKGFHYVVEGLDKKRVYFTGHAYKDETTGQLYLTTMAGQLNIVGNCEVHGNRILECAVHPGLMTFTEDCECRAGDDGPGCPDDAH